MPDPPRVGRYRKTPELGPHVLFFSGDQVYENASPTDADWSSE